MQPTSDLVVRREAGGDPRQSAAVFVGAHHLVPCELHCLLAGELAVCGGPVEPHQLANRITQDLPGILPVGGEPVVYDLRPDLDQLAQRRLVTNDVGVGGDIGRARRGAGQLNQVSAAIDQRSP